MPENKFEVEMLNGTNASAAALALPEPNTSITFGSAGNQLVYYDNPETIDVTASTLACMWRASVGTTLKDVELYTHLQSKGGYEGGFRYGIAVQNNTGSAVTITYKCSAQNTKEKATAGTLDNTALGITNKVLADFQNTSTFKTKRIPANSIAYLCGGEGSFNGELHYITANLHACLKASVSSGVYFRVYVASKSKQDNMSELFSTTVSGWASAVGNFFCGEIGYSQKTCTLDASQTSKVYVLNDWRPKRNQNEYQPVVSYKKNGLDVLSGNYGVIYRLTVNKASNRKIKIIPDWNNPLVTAQTLVGRINGGSWEEFTPLKTEGSCWYRSLGSSNTAIVELILPGGNCGNLTVLFD